MTLIEHREVLYLDTVDPRDGVKFCSTTHGSSVLTMDVVRWMDMGRPNQVVLSVTPVRPPQRWGDPGAPEVIDPGDGGRR